MGIKVLKEDAASRTGGYPVKSGEEIYPGNPCVLEKNGSTGIVELRKWKSGDETSLIPSGLALDSNVMFPVAPGSGIPQTAGEGFDFTNYNRGGLISVIRQATVVIFDDKRSANSSPIDASATFTTLSTPVYVNQSGLITNSSTNAVQIGVLEDFVVSGSTLVSITVRLTIV